MQLINKDAFLLNLHLTQAYCRLQGDKGERDIAKIFRSYNPVFFWDKPLVSFKEEAFINGVHGSNACTLTEWVVDPLHYTDRIFEQQIDFKRQAVFIDKQVSYDGAILICEIDNTVTDGASELGSSGLIDVYDLPPVDTWFYLVNGLYRRLLFAWIPASYIPYANEAILVNCTDCLNWFQDSHPQDYKAIFGG